MKSLPITVERWQINSLGKTKNVTIPGRLLRPLHADSWWKTVHLFFLMSINKKYRFIDSTCFILLAANIFTASLLFYTYIFFPLLTPYTPEIALPRLDFNPPSFSDSCWVGLPMKYFFCSWVVIIDQILLYFHDRAVILNSNKSSSSAQLAASPIQ